MHLSKADPTRLRYRSERHSRLGLSKKFTSLCHFKRYATFARTYYECVVRNLYAICSKDAETYSACLYFLDSPTVSARASFFSYKTYTRYASLKSGKPNNLCISIIRILLKSFLNYRFSLAFQRLSNSGSGKGFYSIS